MATNIPPHNPGEVCDAIAYLIDNPQATIEDLTKIIRGPDFPTGGIIMGREGIQSAYATGHGKMARSWSGRGLTPPMPRKPAAAR